MELTKKNRKQIFENEPYRALILTCKSIVQITNSNVRFRTAHQRETTSGKAYYEFDSQYFSAN